MAAKDYEFYPAAMSGRVYLARRTKSKERNESGQTPCYR